MGMSIEELVAENDKLKRQLAYESTALTMMQADYNARLKADMVAILVELQLELEENTVRWYVGRVDGKSDDVVLMETINDIIQQKINALKGAGRWE